MEGNEGRIMAMQYQLSNTNYEMILTNHMIINELDCRIRVENEVVKYLDIDINGK